jgi:hypothetical protein
MTTATDHIILLEETLTALLNLTEDPNNDADPEESIFTFARQILKREPIPEVSQWQTIDSAPKDGTPIIGGFFGISWADSHRKQDVVRCWYQPEFDAFISSCRQMSMVDGYTIDEQTTKLHSPVVEPVTHWIPFTIPKD